MSNDHMSAKAMDRAEELAEQDTREAIARQMPKTPNPPEADADDSDPVKP